MRRAIYLIAGIALICGVAYLSWFNTEAVELHLTQGWSIRAPLATEITLAFLLGAILVLIANAFRESGRAVTRWRHRRRVQKDERRQAVEEEGRELLWAGEPDRARSVLSRAQRSRPTRGTLLTLIEACLAVDNPQDARRLAQEAGSSLGDDPEVLCALSRSCRRMGDTAGAISALERARGRYPRSTRILAGLRDLYIDAERWNEAAAVHGEWLAVRARKPSAADQNLLGGARYEAAMRIPGPEARLRAMEELAAQSPQFVPAAVSLGDELVTAGRAPDAVRLWEHGLRQNPRTVIAQRLAGVATDRSARDRLRNILRKLRSNDLDMGAVHVLTAHLWLSDGDLDAAQSELDSVHGPAEQSTAYHLARAWVNEQRGRTVEALHAYRQLAAAELEYHCTGCKRPSHAWKAYCPACRRWGTFRSSIELAHG